MKKILMTLAAVICCVVTMVAEPVSPDVAQQAAAKFLQARGASLEGEYMQARGMSRDITGKVQTEASPYYVFNATDSRGFVIVSGDDCVGDNLVLGYTSQGNFDENNVPDNMRWWLDEMANQISELSSRGAKVTAVPTHQDIAPMVTAKWDQQFPYNNFCPETDGELCITGCMATALSQVMYYHRWPQEPIAYEMPAYTMDNGRVIAPLPVTTFDWNNMVDVYKNTTTEEQQTAVATLMRYCGQLVQMKYTPTLSLGVIYDTDLLVNCFGYAPGVYSAKYENYTMSGWDELLYNELSEGRPVIVTGQSASGGHAFVLDGYEVQNGEGYFCVNWGWSGTDNGFYKISLLNPSAIGSGVTSVQNGFSRGQQALIGLQPRQDPSAEFHRYLYGFIWDVPDKKVEHEFIMVNPSYQPGSFTIGLAERNDDGTPNVSRICYTNDFEVSGYDHANFMGGEFKGIIEFPFTTDVLNGLSAGRYELVFINRESNTDAPWKPIYGPAAYIEVNVGDGGEVTKMTFHPQAQLTASDSDIEIEGLKQRCISQIVTATIHNNSVSDEYLGGIDCLACYVENGKLIDIITKAQAGIMVEEDGTAEASYKMSVPFYGDYVFLLTKDGSITDVEDIKGVKLEDIGQLQGYVGHKNVTFGQLAFECLGAGYGVETDEKGNPDYVIGVNLGNGTPMDYDALLGIALYKLNDEGNPVPVEIPDTVSLESPCKINSGTWTLTFIHLPEPLDPGKYVFDIFIADDFHSKKKNDYFCLTTWMIEVAGPTEIEPLSFSPEGNSSEAFTREGLDGIWYDLMGRKLPGRPTQKGMYIFNNQKIVVE